MNEIQNAYFAGLFDGEACFRMKQSRKPGVNSKPIIILNMTNEDIVKSAMAYFGCGTVRVKSPYKNHPHYKKQWQWTAYSRNALEVISQLYPYLKVKKMDAEAIILHYASFNDQRGPARRRREMK